MIAGAARAGPASPSLAALFAAVLAALLLALLAPAQPAAAQPPELEAAAWELIDARSGESLASHRAEQPLPVASATKLMTAWVAMHRLPFDGVVRAAGYSAAPVESVVGLRAGEPVTVGDLLTGLIVASGNDAAVSLAVAAAGSVPAFVELMNREAERLGLEGTHFANPIGLDEPGSHSTARDLAELAARLMARPRFRAIAASRQAVLGSLSPPREIETRNTLLHELPWADGVKTGFTRGAGNVLVGSGTLRGTRLVAVVLGAPSEAARDAATARLLRYGMSLYELRAPVRRGQVLARPEVRYGGGHLPLRAAGTVSLGVRGDQELRRQARAPDEVEGPIERGARLGRAVVAVDGSRIGAVALLAGREVPEAGFADRLLHSPWLLTALALAALFVILIVAATARRRRRKSRDQEWKPQAMGTEPQGPIDRAGGSR